MQIICINNCNFNIIYFKVSLLIIRIYYNWKYVKRYYCVHNISMRCENLKPYNCALIIGISWKQAPENKNWTVVLNLVLWDFFFPELKIHLSGKIWSHKEHKRCSLSFISSRSFIDASTEKILLD